MPEPSVIVRTRDKAATIEQTLSALRRQTRPIEIVVVDSGSTDGTLEIARRHCDQLIQLPPAEFSYGRALNVGAEAAAGSVHFALSAHCVPERADWVERSLSHYERPDVAGTGGYDHLPRGLSIGGDHRHEESGVVHQDIEMLRANPYWGFSNHASSWRSVLWQRFPFDEELEAAEDREWSWRVLQEGWVIAMDPALGVPTPHRVIEGYRAWYRRHRRESRDLASFVPLAPYTRLDALREWWDVGGRRRRFGLRARASPRRIAAFVAKYKGINDSA